MYIYRYIRFPHNTNTRLESTYQQAADLSHCTNIAGIGSVHIWFIVISIALKAAAGFIMGENSFAALESRVRIACLSVLRCDLL